MIVRTASRHWIPALFSYLYGEVEIGGLSCHLRSFLPQSNPEMYFFAIAFRTDTSGSSKRFDGADHS